MAQEPLTNQFLHHAFDEYIRGNPVVREYDIFTESTEQAKKRFESSLSFGQKVSRAIYKTTRQYYIVLAECRVEIALQNLIYAERNQLPLDDLVQRAHAEDALLKWIKEHRYDS